jgi:hypothetical protein
MTEPPDPVAEYLQLVVSGAEVGDPRLGRWASSGFGPSLRRRG